LASALGLAGVALWLAPLAGSVGRGAVAEQAAGLAAVTAAAWERLGQDGDVWLEGLGADDGAGPVLDCDRASSSLPVAPLAANTEPAAGTVAGLVRQALVDLEPGGDRARARATLDSARDLCGSDSSRSSLDLEVLRLAVAAGDCAWAAECFARFAEEVPPRAVEQELSMVALGLLAAAPCLAPESAAEFAAHWLSDAVAGAVPFPTAVENRLGGPAALGPEPRSAALVQRVADLAGPRGEQRAPALAQQLEDWGRRAAWARLGPLPERGGAWLAEGEALWFLWADEAGLRGRRLARETVLARLTAELRAQPLVDPQLTVTGIDGVAGDRVAPPLRLAGLPFPVELRHPDLDRWIAAEGAQVRTVQSSLLALAALAALGGLAVAGLLRRERKLALLRSRWIASVSHELRTPVAALSLAAERLERVREREPGRLPEYHRAVAAETARLVRLVAQVMDLSRLERGAPPAIEPRSVDLEQWLRDFLARVQPDLAARGFAVETEAGPTPDRIAVDVAALERVLENLLRNAQEHGRYGEPPRPGGHEPTRRIGLRWYTAGDRWCLEVRDDGQGCPREARLFEPFERGAGAAAARGVGLGLGIARELVRAHGGELEFLATPHPRLRGAALRIALPVASSEAAAQGAAPLGWAEAESGAPR
jgi:signal transduction histidine kinase